MNGVKLKPGYITQTTELELADQVRKELQPPHQHYYQVLHPAGETGMQLNCQALYRCDARGVVSKKFPLYDTICAPNNLPSPPEIHQR